MSANSKQNLQISDVYALALFETAQEQQVLVDVKADLDAMTDIFSQVADFRELLWSPYFSRNYKASLLEKMFAGKFSHLTMNFLLVVARHNRFKFLPGIIACFARLWDQLHGLVPVSITTSQKFDNPRLQKLCDEITSSLQRKIRITDSIVDPSIIGGIIIHYGDKVIDNTVKTRLVNAVQSVTSKQKWEANLNEI